MTNLLSKQFVQPATGFILQKGLNHFVSGTVPSGKLGHFLKLF